MSAAPRPRPAGAFVPWPVAPAVGVLTGVVVCARLPLPAGPWLGALLVGAGAVAWWRAGRRWPHALAGSGSLALLPFLPVVLLAAGLGCLRLHVWRAGPGERARAVVAEGYAGEAREWRGRSDGEVLRAVHPVRADLAIVMPRGTSAPVGEVVVTGTAEPAAGKRNPGGFDHAEHLSRRGVAAQLFVTSATLVREGARPSDLLAAGVEAGLTPPAAALMSAMTLGRRDDLGALRDTFGAAGMSHLLALSGLHVGVLLLALGSATGRLTRGRVPILAAVTVGFVMLVGASPSVLRAATMTLAALASTAVGAGRSGAWATLALAALLGALATPQLVLDLGFQLSYLAVVGMLLFLPPWTARLAGIIGRPDEARPGWRRLLARLRAAAVMGGLVSLAAQLPTISLVAGTFLSVPLASPLVNVLAVPLAGVLVPLGFIAGLLGLVAEPLARLVNLGVGPLAAALIWLAEGGARLPSLAWAEIGPVGHAAWAAFVATCAAWAHLRLRRAQAIALFLVAGGAAYAVPGGPAAPDIWFLDVGQGDSALLRPAPGVAILVDGGGSPFSDFDVGARVVVPALRALGVTRLSAVVATHPDADHAEGLLSVMESFRVGLLVTGPPTPGNALDERLREAAARRGVRVHVAQRGERLLVGGAQLDVLNPAAQGGASSNDASVAFVLRVAGVPRALFLGDLGLGVEPELAVPPLDVLMVGHHGSRYSTGAGLVAAVGPRLAVISVGRNAYGHPSAEVVARLEGSGATVLTTREHGAVRFDLRSLTWTSSVQPRPRAGVIDCSQCS